MILTLLFASASTLLPGPALGWIVWSGILVLVLLLAGLIFLLLRLSRLGRRTAVLEHLLLSSQTAASTLDIQPAVQPVLQVLLSGGASAAGVAFTPAASQQVAEAPRSFSLGPQAGAYPSLYPTLLRAVQQHDPLFLQRPADWLSLGLPEGTPVPASLAAAAVVHQADFLGVLWVAYLRPHRFSEQEAGFLAALAGQAARTASGARLGRGAELGRQRLAAILSSTPDPVLVTDQENRLILANPAARELLGAQLGPGEGLALEQAVQQNELRALLLGQPGNSNSTELTLPDGKVYSATASAVIADGHPVGRVCVLRDVTHFKELDSLKTDFVSAASHDLRSPLTLIRGYATMLETDMEMNDQQRSYVGKIILGVEGMSRLVNNLLDLSRIEAGVGLLVEKVRVVELLEGVVESLRLQAEHKKITLRTETGPDLPPQIEADRTLLQQAIYNLVENALKYTPESGSVLLRAAASPEGVCFSVQDNGIGIPAADLPRLFEKFFRGSAREARAQRGSGLGLAMVRSIAERHGGRVWVESTQGHGSTFYLAVPPCPPQERSGKKG
jgi:PAS domain S-box-containing protein